MTPVSNVKTRSMRMDWIVVFMDADFFPAGVGSAETMSRMAATRAISPEQVQPRPSIQGAIRRELTPGNRADSPENFRRWLW
jgi:hypothetical protein